MAKINTTPPSLTNEEILRFWSYVDKSIGQGPQGTCWEWKARCNPYGRYTNHFKGRQFGAHRLAFFLIKNYWPIEQLNHHCDNPRCCNPDHLYEGTQQDNLNDAMVRNRVAKGDKNGARLYPERLSRGDTHYMRAQPEKVPRGSKHGMSKLTEDKVLWIREQHTNKTLGNKQMAKMLGVSYSLVYMVVKRQIWTHV